jgi:hypothetical protein
MPLQLGEQLAIGREGELPIATDPEDPGVSRVALTVTARPAGWELWGSNRNGVVLHRWGQPAATLELERAVHVRWPRIGVRLSGTLPGTEHWVLLEGDDYAVSAPASPQIDTADGTVVPAPPRPLTEPQRMALVSVFAEYLAWPPLTSPQPVARETAGRHLGISYAGVVDRLQGAQRKALQLGSTQHVGLMDPDYLYLLVARGYLAAPNERFPAREVKRAG